MGLYLQTFVSINQMAKTVSFRDLGDVQEEE